MLEFNRTARGMGLCLHAKWPAGNPAGKQAPIKEQESICAYYYVYLFGLSRS